MAWSPRSFAWILVLVGTACTSKSHSGASSGSRGESVRAVADFEYAGVVVHPGELPPVSMLNALCAELAGALHPERALVEKLRDLIELVTTGGMDPSLGSLALEEWSDLRRDVDYALRVAALNRYDDIANDEAARRDDGEFEDQWK